MKIGIVCYPTFGGSGVIATELGISLAEKGHEVHFITYNQPARLEHFHANTYYHEVSVLKYDLFQYPPYEVALSSKIVDVTLNENLDILHVHYAIPHASAAYMARQMLKEKGVNIPFITTLHGTDITLVGKDPSFAPAVAFSINQSDGVTTVSESLRKDTLAEFDIKKNIKVIPNFIDFKRFRKVDMDHFKKAICPNGEKLLIHVSNFRSVKRVHDIIRMFDQVRKQIPAKLLLVGDGPDRFSAEQLCRELGVCNDIRFLGKQHAVEDLLAVSDLFVLPSESESFGLAALEAMACELPVVATGSGGIPEVIDHGQSGLLCAVGDIDQLAINTLEILKDPAVHLAYKEEAIKKAKTFSIDRILPLYEAYYEEIIELNS